MARPDDDLVEQLERFREEQRAVRAARRADRHRLRTDDPDQQAAGPPGVGGGTGVPAGPVGTGTLAAGETMTAVEHLVGNVAGTGDPTGEREAGGHDGATDQGGATDDGGAGGQGDAVGKSDATDQGDAGGKSDATDQGDSSGAGEVETGPGPAGGLSNREVMFERIRTGVRGLGQALITFGVIILLFVVYELWVTDLFNKQKQGQLAHQLSDTWDRGDDPLAPPTVGEPGAKVRSIPLGEGIALIRIPALGLDYVRVIVEGTSEASLAEGPGHYVTTALPGQLGNFAVAGHRVGKGSPFLDLDRLKAGDAIVIETKTSYFVYRVLGDRRTGDPSVPGEFGIPGQQIVDPSETDVIRPVPGHPGLAPNGRFLTLTTCHPRFSARERLIIHAVLNGPAWPKSKGLPPVLKG